MHHQTRKTVYSSTLISLFALLCFLRALVVVVLVVVLVGDVWVPSGWPWFAVRFSTAFRAFRLLLFDDSLSCFMRSSSSQHSLMFPAIHPTIRCLWERMRDSLHFRRFLVGTINTTFSLDQASSSLYTSISVLAKAKLSYTLITHCPHRRWSCLTRAAMRWTRGRRHFCEPAFIP